MSSYHKPMTCTRCGFLHRLYVNIHGDFDGWEDSDLEMSPAECPFCQHARKANLYALLKIPRLKKLAKGPIPKR